MEDLLGRHLVVHNDEVNTFDWVIQSLVEICRHSVEQAEQCAMIIHFKGKYAVRQGRMILCVRCGKPWLTEVSMLPLNEPSGHSADNRSVSFPYHSDADGLVAIGGGLSVRRLLAAYSIGLFPWFEEDGWPFWFLLTPDVC